jgi:hypothetical protein
MKKKNIKNNEDNIFITENLTKFRQSAHLFVVDPSESWEPYGISVMSVTRTVPTLRFDCVVGKQLYLYEEEKYQKQRGQHLYYQKSHKVSTIHYQRTKYTEKSKKLNSFWTFDVLAKKTITRSL